MEHLANCHGEWNHFFQFLAIAGTSLPFVGVWIKSALTRPHKGCGDDHP